jgi:hypothetical protein
VLEGYSHGQRWTFAPMEDHPSDPQLGAAWSRLSANPPLVSSPTPSATIEGFHRSLADLPNSGAEGLRRRELPQTLLGYGASQGGKDYAYVD